MTPWTLAYQAPLSMGFSRREYWSGLLHMEQLSMPPTGSQELEDLYKLGGNGIKQGVMVIVSFGMSSH